MKIKILIFKKAKIDYKFKAFIDREKYMNISTVLRLLPWEKNLNFKLHFSMQWV